MSRFFGSIPGIEEGTTFQNRLELSRSGVHMPTQAGISGTQSEGADSIVLSGGYKDDEDEGDVIVYTGKGGRDEKTGEQISDQELTGGNKALVISFEEQLPVRVIRGSEHKSIYSPSSGYRYDGIYLIENYWHEQGQDGYRIWRFRLTKSDRGPISEAQISGVGDLPNRIPRTVNSIVRNSKVSRLVKQMYDDKCQICNSRIETPIGNYSEAAHIRPLGLPHFGKDSVGNVLCLCPNHHKMFDYHCFSINDDLSLIGIKGTLTLDSKHNLDLDNLRYHREYFSL